MSEVKPIRVMIVDDHTMTRTGLKFFIKAFPDLELLGEASNAEEALALCAKTLPDVILMDMVMPGLDGAEATHLIRQRYPQAQIIALTSFQEGDLVERALKSGAIGYLLKNVSAQELAAAIRAAHTGHSTVAPEVTEILVKAARQGSKPGHDLTEREQEVLALLVEGLSNAQIAERLVISQATVKYHVRGILSKLNAANRAEAVSLAWQYNLVKH
jgi:NarL family two-component system response regulator LiaR